MSQDLSCAACGGYVSRRDWDEYVADSPNDVDARGEPWCSGECAHHLRGWGKLELLREDSGWRHFLHGEPVRCGYSLELQAAPVPGPRRDDYASETSYERALRAAEKERAARTNVLVRYESPLYQEKPPPALLHVDVAGHEAVVTAHAGMRLRWLAKRR